MTTIKDPIYLSKKEESFSIIPMGDPPRGPITLVHSKTNAGATESTHLILNADEATKLGVWLTLNYPPQL